MPRRLLTGLAVICIAACGEASVSVDDVKSPVAKALACPDSDGDGYLATWCGGSDCDDSNRDAYPGANDICGDGVDQDCDGVDSMHCVLGQGLGCQASPWTAASHPSAWLVVLLALGAAARWCRQRLWPRSRGDPHF